MPSKKDLDHLRGEVGEQLVAYEFMRRGWDVMLHLGGHGYDLLITKGGMNQQTVEVKTVDPRYKTGKWNKQLTCIFSKDENKANWLVYLIHSMSNGNDIYFIVPQRAFPQSGSITVNIDKNGEIARGSAYEEYRDNWTPFK